MNSAPKPAVLKEKKNQGFSLIELLMAIGILSLTGLLVLQVFLSSIRQNEKALQIDKSVNLCVSVIERLKQENHLVEWNEDVLLQIFPDAEISKDDNGYSLYWKLNLQWTPYNPFDAIAPSYILALSVMPDQETDYDTSIVTIQTYTFDEEKWMTDHLEDSTPLFSIQAVLVSSCDLKEADNEK